MITILAVAAAAIILFFLFALIGTALEKTAQESERRKHK
jgi:hypothetical protein